MRFVGHMRRDLAWWCTSWNAVTRSARDARSGALDRPAMAEDLAGMYDVNLEVRVVNERGVLGRAAAAMPRPSPTS